MKNLMIAALLCATPAMAENVNGLRTVDEFDSIEAEGERSVALFEEMMVVIEHPRCSNCHPVDNSPRQGDDMRMHQPPVVRGAADFGAPGMRCTTCHSEENVAFETGEGSIPGHDPWNLAPISMGWIGKSASEICAQLKDPERNGGKSLAELHEHNAEDGLVGWGWEPGKGRTPAPGSQKVFGELTQAWIDTGAACPSS
ncbi:Isoquinoline 1-oxidoreductase subunit [Sagittula sp. NFXS13]|uniref:Isoquinoline 1-oxidoreductase subunit n=1 Tax=Sagittula marina TaxID=943940 RepID=A0A7W6GRL0_9RHOB|nr:Isoquinoline 1-oxidoreductase subunit [Sagittula marina]MBB3985025.1 hypothetical protein [Sagittula marina]